MKLERAQNCAVLFFRVIVGRVIVKDTHVVQYCAQSHMVEITNAFREKAEDLEIYRVLSCMQCENWNGVELTFRFIKTV